MKDRHHAIQEGDGGGGAPTGRGGGDGGGGPGRGGGDGGGVGAIVGVSVDAANEEEG